MAFTLEPIGSLATPEVIEAAVLSTAANAATAEAAVALIEPGVPGGIATLDVDGAIPESQVPARLSDSSLSNTIAAQGASLIALAKNPDSIIAGAITGDPVTSAAVLWPGGVPGVMTITERHSTGAVNAYNITYGDPVTQTFTQPAITRSATGAATNVPQIVVS